MSLVGNLFPWEGTVSSSSLRLQHWLRATRGRYSACVCYGNEVSGHPRRVLFFAGYVPGRLNCLCSGHSPAAAPVSAISLFSSLIIILLTCILLANQSSCSRGNRRRGRFSFLPSLSSQPQNWRETSASCIAVAEVLAGLQYTGIYQWCLRSERKMLYFLAGEIGAELCRMSAQEKASSLGLLPCGEKVVA